MIENRVKSEQISNHVKKLREEIKHLEASIKQFTHFGGSEYDIRKMFELMSMFFTQQGQNISEDWKQLDGLKSYHPFKDQVTNSPNVASTVGVLNEYQAKLSAQVNEMEAKVKQLEAQIQAAYGIPEMQKKPYHLHSICVHDGNANSGHYYSFIYDRFNKKWRRYNDIRVTEVTEEDVFKESEGGY